MSLCVFRGCNFSKLKYSYFAMLYQSLLYSKMTQLYACLHSFCILLSIVVYHRILNIVPCATCIRTLLFIHSKWNSLHLPTQNPQSICLFPTPALATTSLFSMSVNISVLLIIYLCHILYSTYV